MTTQKNSPFGRAFIGLGLLFVFPGILIIPFLGILGIIMIVVGYIIGGRVNW